MHVCWRKTEYQKGNHHTHTHRVHANTTQKGPSLGNVELLLEYVEYICWIQTHLIQKHKAKT